MTKTEVGQTLLKAEELMALYKAARLLFCDNLISQTDYKTILWQIDRKCKQEHIHICRSFNNEEPINSTLFDLLKELGLRCVRRFDKWGIIK
jgi:hypothetical protein